MIEHAKQDITGLVVSGTNSVVFTVDAVEANGKLIVKQKRNI